MALQNAFGDLALDASVVATNTKLDAVITALGNLQTELNQKLEAGQEVALSSATLAALETITAVVNNFPSDYPDVNTLAKLEQIRVLLAGTLTISGAVTVASITNGSQKSQIIDASGDIADVVQLGTQVTATDKGLVTNSVIHGKSTAGGGTFVDVKVTPSGALSTETTITDSALPTGASTLTEQQAQTTKLNSLDAKDFATQTTLASLLAKVIAAPSTEAKQDAILTELQLKANLTETQPIIQTGVQFLFSTVNSTIAQLASGATFTGGVEDVTEFPSLSFLAFADQNLTITVNQFIDPNGLKLTETQTFSYVANEKFGISFPINGNYIQVVVKNEGGSTTTKLQVDTAYGIIDQTNEIRDDFLIGQATQTATVNNIFTPTSGTAPLDVTKYRSFVCQVVSTGTAGTFIFEGSNDGVNFQAIPVYNQALVVRVPIVTAITATASQIMYEGSCNFKYIRLRIVTTITGGSIRAFTTFLHSNLGTTSQIVSNGTAANFLATVSGTITANIGTGALSAGTNAIGDVGLQVRANATGAASKTHLVSAATTNPTIVKASAGRLLGWRIYNTNAAVRYVKLHNQTTAPTAGTGVAETIPVPPNGIAQGNIPQGSGFTTGIGMTTVTGGADADATAVGAGDLIIDLYWA